MKWIERFLDAIFKHLYSVCAVILLFVLGVLLIAMSAQYLGDRISKTILNHKSIEMLFFMDYNTDKQNEKDMLELIHSIDNNYNLRPYNIKIRIMDINKNFIPKTGARIIVSVDQNFMEKLANDRKLAVLDHAMFASRTRKYIEFSKYDEYVLAETISNHLKVYIAYTNEETSTEKVKVIKTINALSNNILRKVDLQPDA